MEWLGALLLVAGIIAGCQLFGVVARSRQVLGVTEHSLWVMADRALSEEAKEDRLQAGALQLFKLFGLLVVLGAAAVLLPLALIWLVGRSGFWNYDGVLRVTLSAPFLWGMIVLTVAVLFIWWRRGRARAQQVGPGVFENRYSAVDRWVHAFAFASAPVQVACSRLEDRMFRRRIAAVKVARPVFITALPRAGTTVLLNLCATQPEFVTHTYRQMPFLFTPLWWDAFTRRFRAADVPQERAHGDGLLVSADSPEALEEMLWLEYWPEHYAEDRVIPWPPEEAQAGFEPFFRQHMRKLAALQSRAGRSAYSAEFERRYISKNNANLGRVRWLAQAFPSARFLIPFRPPLQHAASLLQQHLNFMRIHAEDPFARLYMAGVGHFDFGANLRPIDFGGWRPQDGPGADPRQLEFWLRYWIAAYRDVATLSAGDRVRFVRFHRLCQEPRQGLAELAGFLDLADPAGFVRQAETLHPPREHAVDVAALPPSLVQEAEGLHQVLCQLAAPAGARVNVTAWQEPKPWSPEIGTDT